MSAHSLVQLRWTSYVSCTVRSHRRKNSGDGSSGCDQRKVGVRDYPDCRRSCVHVGVTKDCPSLVDPMSSLCSVANKSVLNCRENGATNPLLHTPLPPTLSASTFGSSSLLVVLASCLPCLLLPFLPSGLCRAGNHWQT